MLRARGKYDCRGFTYLWVLFLVGAVSVALAAAGEQWVNNAAREQRSELQWVGMQYRNAIASYYESSPGAAKQYPPSLEDLLEDRRFVVPRRHLRRLYPDPGTRSRDWELLRAPDGGIMGVYRRASRALREARFVYVPEVAN